MSTTLAAVFFLACAPLSGGAAAAQQLAANGGARVPNPAPAESRAPSRRIASVRGAETPDGARVVVTSDSSLDGYGVSREGRLFSVTIPRADASGVLESARDLAAASAVEGARVEQRGSDVVLTFAVRPGYEARARQIFNRLELHFAAAGQSGGQSATPAQTPRPQDPPAAAPSPSQQTEGSVTAPPSPPTSDSSTTREAAGTARVAAGGGRSHVTLPPEKSAPLRIPRLDRAPVIDGKLDEEVWKQAAVLRDFYQVEPGDNIAPSRPTLAYVGYDSKFLYVAFKATDEPDKVRARIAKRDQVFDDDYVGMFIDTFNDQRKAYEVDFNPLGIQADAIYSENSGEDFSFDLVMESKGVITSDGYTVEAAIPFKSLRYTAGKDKLWGLHAFRRIKRFNNELDSWMPLSRDISGTLLQAGKITGLEGISTERTLELIPSLTLSETGRRVAAGPPPEPFPGGTNSARPDRFVNPPVDLDLGLTAKYTLTPTVTLDFAYNPDFAQVEADATVVTANQRFPIFFEEKRPFFLEGKEIFETRNSVVHTRAIIDPDYAVKLTGKLGRNTFGLILASDAGPGSFSEDERADPANARFVDKNAFVGVLRLKRDVGKESSVGLFGTTYNFVERHNHVAGIDGRFKVNPKTVAAFEVVGSRSRRLFRDPDLDPAESPGQRAYRTGDGLAYSWVYDYTGRHFGYVFEGGGRTRDYRADVGFTRQTDTNNALAGFRYSTEPNPKAILTKFTLRNFTQAQFNWDASLQSWIDGTNYEFSFAHQTFVQLGTNFGYERVFEGEFGPRRGPARPTGRLLRGAFAGDDDERQTRQRTVFVYAERQFNKQFYASTFVGTRRGIFDFDFGAGPRFPRVSPAALALGQRAPLDPGSANGFDIDASVNYKPTNALNASLNYTKARLTRRDTGLVAFDDNIYTLRATYQFTRFTFARARVDYQTLASNVRGQFLLGWTPNPGTAFYAGYNDDLNRNGFNPFNGDLEPGFRRNGRTFFIKASYLFRRSFE